MQSGADKNWAHQYLIDPLNGPEPAAETGLSSSSVPQRTPSKDAPVLSVNDTGSSTSTNPFRRGDKNGVQTRNRALSTDSSGHLEPPPTYKERKSGNTDDMPQRRSADSPRAAVPGKSSKGHHHRRSSSLRDRFPGDESAHPLDQITRENKLANRSPHLKKKHLPGADMIDELDNALGKYHHEGPYDAALLARNNSYTISPVAALQHSNAEALKATPRDKIKDSLNDHRPLDGTSFYPPGTRDQFGQEYNYEEGTDVMRDEYSHDGGAYKRYPGVKYLPEDLKGKGEPSYSMDKLQKQREAQTKGANGEAGVELTERPRKATGDRHYADGTREGETYRDWETGRRRGESTGSRISGELKRRVGSLRRKDK